MRKNNVKQEIKEYFFQHPTVRLRVRQVEREVKVTLPSAIRYAKELESEGILKRIQISGVTFHQADRTSKRYLLEKKLYNIRQLHETGLVDHLKGQCRDAAMILFGSYEKAEDIEDSDIDIFIQAKKKQVKGLDIYEKKLGRGIQLFTEPKIRNIRNKDLANNILNGTRLNGFIEVF
jgi:predicted nucleotidyltransferase